VDVGRTAQREVDGAAGNGRIRLAVDQDETTERLVFRIRLERDRLVEVEVAVADLVEFQALGREVLLGVHVDLVLDLGDRRRHGARADLDPVRATRQQRRVIHPQQVRGELVGDFGRALRGGDHVAAADIDFVLQRERDRLAFVRALQLAVGGHD
jgi:hypothetical protein